MQLGHLHVQLAVLQGPEAITRLDLLREFVVQVRRVALDAEPNGRARHLHVEDLRLDPGGRAHVEVALVQRLIPLVHDPALVRVRVTCRGRELVPHRAG